MRNIILLFLLASQLAIGQIIGVVASSGVTPYDSGIFTNGDFETNTDDWILKDGVISYETTSPITGSGSLKFDNSSGNLNGGARQNAGLVDTKTYRCTGKMKMISGGTGTVKIYTSTSSGYSQTLEYTGSSIAVGETVSFSADFTPNASTQVCVQFSIGLANAVYLIDDLTLIEL